MRVGHLSGTELREGKHIRTSRSNVGFLDEHVAGMKASG